MMQVIDFIGGEYRNRTGVHGFAIRCVTTPPTRRLFHLMWRVVSGHLVCFAFYGGCMRGARAKTTLRCEKSAIKRRSGSPL